MELKSWETLGLLKSDLEKAVAEHDAALAKLYRNGSPIFAADIMAAEATKARQTLTAKLDRLTEKAAAIETRAEATTAAALDDPYSWLNADELARAALLRPFIAEDVPAAGVKGLANLAMQVKTGQRKLDRVMAWLIMREAEKIEGAATDSFMRAALPPDIAKADQEAQDAHVLKERIERARPEWQERIQRNIIGQANWDATGKPIGQ